MSAYSAVLRTAGSQVFQLGPLGWKLLDLTERMAAGAALIALAPWLALTAVAIAVLSGRAPLVAVRRVGRNGADFWVLKLRTMWGRGESAAPGPRLVEYVVDESGPGRKRTDDPRVSHAFARFCRRYSIDELPQLIHVVSGRMSFVGPRPVTRTELEVHYGRSAWKVLTAKPGLTGLWQVMGRNRLSYRQRLRLDLFYVEKRRIGLYLRIVTRTIPLVVSGVDSW